MTDRPATPGKGLRIVYMGTPDFAVAPLRRLVEEGYQVVSVITMPDKPAGRGLKLQESAVKRYAKEAGIPVLQPEKLKNPEFVAQFRALNADLAIVIAFRMLPEIIWSSPRLGTFNLHASLLPQYRGAAPINWALINGENRTGVTTFMLNHEIDKGDILGQHEVAISPEDNAGTLHDKLMNAGVELVTETVEAIAAGTARPIVQPESEKGLLKEAPKIFKDDCRIDWSETGENIRNLVRGLSPYPAAWSALSGTQESSNVKIYEVRFERAIHSHPPGMLFTDGKKYLKTACADGYILIGELQMAGKKRMKTEEFLRGFKGIENCRFE